MSLMPLHQPALCQNLPDLYGLHHSGLHAFFFGGFHLAVQLGRCCQSSTMPEPARSVWPASLCIASLLLLEALPRAPRYVLCQICVASIPHHSALAAFFFFLRRFQALLDIRTFPTNSSVLGTASVLAVTAPPPCTASSAS
jgi:hypothetical protein